MKSAHINSMNERYSWVDIENRISWKCPRCYQDGSCMLTRVSRAYMCVGPFDSLVDEKEKVRNMLIKTEKRVYTKIRDYKLKRYKNPRMIL